MSGTEAAPPAPSLQAAIDYSIAYFRAIWQAMVLGLLLAATIESSVPRDLLAIAGTLFAIPTAGEIPVIQTMLLFGIGAGPAGVLLLTLPSTSLPSLLMVWKAFSWRIVVLLGVATAIVGLLAGGVAITLGL